MITSGILYIAAGARYIRAAVRSAQSVAKHCPGLPMHLFADWPDHPGFAFDRDARPFTSVARIDHPHRRSKLDYLPQTPFERTLYMDTDTQLNADIRGLFDLLDRFDVGLCHAHRRYPHGHVARWRIDLPASFPQYNGGILLYRRTPEVIRFLEEWRDSFMAAGYLQDQVTLRELLWLSQLQVATLPPEYNVRYIKYRWIWTKAEATPQIFHLRRLHVGWIGWLVGPWSRRLRRLLQRALRGGGAPSRS